MAAAPAHELMPLAVGLMEAVLTPGSGGLPAQGPSADPGTSSPEDRPWLPAIEGLLGRWGELSANDQQTLEELGSPIWPRVARAVLGSAVPAVRARAVELVRRRELPLRASDYVRVLSDTDESVRSEADRLAIERALRAMGSPGVREIGPELRAFVAGGPERAPRSGSVQTQAGGVDAMLTPGRSELARKADFGELVGALAELAWTSRPRLPRVLSVVAVLAVGAGEAAWAWLPEASSRELMEVMRAARAPGHAVRASVEALARSARGAWLASAAWRLSGRGRDGQGDEHGGSPLVEARAGRAVPVVEAAAWAGLGHLVLGRRRGASERVLSAVASAAGGASAAGAARVAMVAGRGEASEAVLGACVVSGDAVGRLVAGRAIGAARLPDGMFDADEAVGRAAAWRWSALSPEVGGKPMRPVMAARRRLAYRLARSADVVRAGVGLDEVSRLDISMPERASSRAVARSWLRADGASCLDAVRGALASDDAARVGQGLALVERLGIADSVRGEVVGLLSRRGSGAWDEASTARVAAMAASAIGACPACGVGDVTVGLDDRDARVRANCVEAAGRLGRRRVSLSVFDVTPMSVVELKDDRHHRVRANAVRAMIEAIEPGEMDEPAVGDRGSDEGASRWEELLRLLSDLRAEHRLAGLWLAERLALTLVSSGPAGVRDRVAAAVARSAASDEEPGVRRRARRPAEKLLTLMELAEPKASARTREPMLRMAA